MTNPEIEMEFMTHLYRQILDKGREPDLDEFETNEIDEALNRWAEEDDEFLDAYALRDYPGAWEEIDIHD